MNPQFKKGALELCVLAQLAGRDRYGYELTERISERMEISAGTLYPILKRLKDDACVETYLVESDAGPARKYYHLTENGNKYLHRLRREWNAFIQAVEGLTEQMTAKQAERKENGHE